MSKNTFFYNMYLTIKIFLNYPSLTPSSFTMHLRTHIYLAFFFYFIITIILQIFYFISMAPFPIFIYNFFCRTLLYQIKENTDMDLSAANETVSVYIDRQSFLNFSNLLQINFKKMNETICKYNFLTHIFLIIKLMK